MTILVTLLACAKPDTLAGLERDAVDLVATRQPDLVRLVGRIAMIKRDLRGNRPGWEQMMRVADLANDELGLPPFTQTLPPGPAWAPSPASLLGIGPHVCSHAAELATTHKHDELAFLVADARRRYDEGIARVDDRLGQLERWIASGRTASR